MPTVGLLQTMVSNANLTGTLRSPKSQSWEVAESTLTQEPSVTQEFAEIGDHLAYLLWCVDPWLMGKYL